MNFTKIAIERPSLVVVIFSLLIFLGVMSYTFLSYELVPKFTPPVVAITTVYPGASPLEVEESVTKKIEDAVISLENLDQVKAVSQENFSVVRLYISPGADVELFLQNAQRRINALLNTLPSGAESPSVSRFDIDDFPILRIGASSSLGDAQFYDLLRADIQPALAQVNGVAQVRLLGGRQREIKVRLHRQKLQAYRVAVFQVIQAIRAANLDFPAGKIKNEEEQLFIRMAGKFESLDELQEVVVAASPFGGKIRLKDIATIVDSEKEPQVITRVNGQSSLGIDIRKQSDANAVEMSRDVREKLAQLEVEYGDEQLSFNVSQDTSEFTIQAANAVLVDLSYAIVLVSLVMLLFLHSLRNSLIVLVSIPTSIISTFVVMYVMGYSLNLMSLLALSLAIGILVDDSIVVIENIYRHLEMGKNRVVSAFEGRMEIGFTAVSITLIDVVVFLPIVFAEGIVADLFRQFSVVIVTSTMMSLFVSFTIVPLLASRFSKLERLSESTWIGKLVHAFEASIDRMINWMVRQLQWCFRHPYVTLLLAVLLFAGSISLMLFGFIGTEFLKAGDRGEFVVELELPRDATLEQTNLVAQQVEGYLLGLPEVTNVFTTVGITSSGRIESNTNYLAELSVRLVDKRERQVSSSFLARQIKIDLESSIAGVSVRPIEINILGLRDDDAVEVTISGSNTVALLPFADKVAEELDDIAGTVEVKSSMEGTSSELGVKVDREKMASLGLNLAAVGGTLQAAFNGNTDAKYREEGLEYDINVQLDQASRRNVNDILQLTVVNPIGQLVPLKQFAFVESQPGPAQLERTDRSTSVTIKSQVIGRPGGTVGAELADRIDALEMPEGVSYAFGGTLERQAEGFKTLAIAIIASIFFVYLIMVALYDSYVYPFVVLFSIPMAVIGALLLLALTKQSMNIFSILGVIMLIGLVGKNAILVVDFTNKLKEKGMELKEALLEATRLRFRPILMTNLSMVIGLLPIALASSPGSEWKNGLALALIGGLSSSMFLSLLLVPVIYYLVERALTRLGWNKGKKVLVPPA